MDLQGNLNQFYVSMVIKTKGPQKQILIIPKMQGEIFQILLTSAAFGKFDFCWLYYTWCNKIAIRMQ